MKKIYVGLLNSLIKTLIFFVILSFIIFIIHFKNNSSKLNFAYLSILIVWIIVQIKASKSLPGFDFVLVMQILCEITMITLSFIMITSN